MTQQQQAKKRSSYRAPVSEEARQHRNAYLRKYRKEHPDKARAWRQNYIKRAAARLEAAEGGAEE